MSAQLTRRTILAGVGALGLAGMVRAQGAAPAANWLPGDPVDHWRHLVRLQASTRPEDVIWWYTGRIYAQVAERAPQHLFNLEGSEIYWARQMPDGAFAISGRTLTFFRDKGSGEILSEFRNPLTGRINLVRPNRLGGKDGSIYSADGWHLGAANTGKDRTAPWQLEWDRAADLAWLTSSRFRQGPPQPLLECMTIFCPLDALLDTRIHNLAAHLSSTYLSPWQQWLEMDGRPGHLVWHSSGKKLQSVDQLPEQYRQRVAREYGDVLTARPESWD